MRALGEAGLSFQSLICDIGVPVRPFECLRKDTLKNLSMTIEPRLITGANKDSARGNLLTSFSELTNLESLSLELRDFKGFDRYYDGMADGMSTYEDQATQVLQAIQTMTKLCNVTMAGEWDFSR